MLPWLGDHEIFWIRAEDPDEAKHLDVGKFFLIPSSKELDRWRMRKIDNLHPSSIFFHLQQLDLLQLQFFGALWSSLSSSCFLFLQLNIMSCEPYISDDIVQFLQRQHATFGRDCVIEKTININL